MKTATFLKQLFFFSLYSSSILKADLLIPGDNDGPHADKVMIFDGRLNFWANDLYGFTEGKAVEFNNAGTVTIDGTVMPKSLQVKGDGITIWNGLGQIIGDTSLEKEGVGTLEMNATNAYTGGTLIKGGTVRAGGTGSFGSGRLELIGGVLDLDGYDITNEIQLCGGQLLGASAISSQLIFRTDYNIQQNIATRSIQLGDGLQVKVDAGATLSVQEELVLAKAGTLDLTAGGEFRGNLTVEADGVLKLSTQSSTPIATGNTWHLNGSTISGNLSTAQVLRETSRNSTAGATLKISGKCRINGALTLNGGSLKFSDAGAALHADTVVLSNATALQMDTPRTIGDTQTFLTYKRLLAGNVTDYYNFFGIDRDVYTLTVDSQSISLTVAEPPAQQEPPPTLTPEPPADTPSDTPADTPSDAPADTPSDTPPNRPVDTPPNTPPTGNEDGLPGAPPAPGPIVPGAGNDTEDNAAGTQNPGASDSDSPHGPVIDSSGDSPDDPHNNKDTETTPDDEADADTLLSPHIGTALSQAAMQSAWGARFASHAFMSAVYDNSRNSSSTTWAAFFGGLMDTDGDGSLPGGEISTYGLAIGAEAHPSQRTQLGLALGAAPGSISGESFGELEQLSIQAAAYFRRSFLKAESRHRLRLYAALGAGRTETDPGMYSGLDNWHHNNFMAQTRLCWGLHLHTSVIWEIYSGVDYYRGSAISVDEEAISGLSILSGSIGSDIAWETGQTTLYAEAEFNGDIVRDTPTAVAAGHSCQTAAPERCGLTLRCGIQLQPEDTQRSIRLNYAFEPRNNSSAHVLSAGFTRIF